jgi:ATP-binding cassette subfamily F protein 2
MSSKWHQKKAKEAEEAFERELQSTGNNFNENVVAKDIRDAAMGGGDKELFEKKLSKEEKKARAKAAREAKKKAKMKEKGVDVDEDDEDDEKQNDENETGITAAQMSKEAGEDGIDHEQADLLAADGTICTFAASRKGVDPKSRDINVQNFTLQHKGFVMLDETEIILNHGNRYGLIGRNGCGKSTLMKALGARAVPIPRSIDIFFLKEEVEASDTVTALEAVMSVDEERLRLEHHAEELNLLLTELAEKEEGYQDEDGKTTDEIQEEVMDTLNSVYERLDALDAATAEVRARSILQGLGFTHEMQSKKTKDFSGGWRMRVSLARALFIQPVCLLLDEPTNHLGKFQIITAYSH